MKLKKIGGKLFTVNLLADFILNKIPKEENSIIKVVDCENFLVIKGKTSSKEILNVSEIVTEFVSKYEKQIKNKKISHTIDLIEYDSDFEIVKKIKQTYHNSEKNCSYSDCSTESSDDDFINVSSFPHGHSLSQGRLFFYYGKKIFYNIPSTYPVRSLTFEISNEKNLDGEPCFEVFDEYNQQDDPTLRSAILDVFDFDFTKLEKEIKKVDWSLELTNPLEEFDILKERVKDFIIL